MKFTVLELIQVFLRSVIFAPDFFLYKIKIYKSYQVTCIDIVIKRQIKQKYEEIRCVSTRLASIEIFLWSVNSLRQIY